MVTTPPPDPALVELFRSELSEHACKLADTFKSAISIPSTEMLAELAGRAYSIESAARILSFEPVAELAARVKELLAGDLQRATTSQRDAAIEAVTEMRHLAILPAIEIPSAIATLSSRFLLLCEQLSRALPDKTQTSTTPIDISPLNEPRWQLTSSAGLDTSLAEMFIAELQTQASSLERGLIRAEENASPALIESLMRAAHSIKGAARMMGFHAAVNLAHAMEDLLIAAQRKELSLTASRIDALLQGSDFFLRTSRSSPSEIAIQLESESVVASAITTYLQRLRDPSQDSTSTPPALNFDNKLKLTPNRSRNDGMVKILAENLNRLTGLSGECLIEVQSAAPLRTDFLRTSREQMSALSALQSGMRSLDEGAPEIAKDHLQIASRTLETIEKLFAAQTEKFNDLFGRLEFVVDGLHREAIASRMCPFSEGVFGFPRMVHDLARNLKKSVRFDIRGESTRVDRDILAHLEGPLTHLLRNSVDHGIETPEVRENSGKPPYGSLVLEARHVAGMLEVLVSDDGAGVDFDRIKKQIVDSGYAPPETTAGLAESELLEFLFLPGFSTAQKLTDVSGRGVGLDVVRTVLLDIGGSIRIQSQAGKGCSFEMKLPLTRAVLRCLVVEIAAEPYAFPLNQIDSVHVISGLEIEQLKTGRFYHYEGETLPLMEAATLLRCQHPSQAQNDRVPVVITGEPGTRYGLMVDTLIGHRDLVVLPLDKRLGKIPNVTAAAILEDGRTALLLDGKEIVEAVQRVLSEGEWKGASVAKASLPVSRDVKRILVVDDSMTVRQLQRRILTNQGYEVVLAVDGMDGWNTVQSETFDLVITDVDMPRLSGIDLIRKMKASKRTTDIPAMIVSYKNDEEHRRVGLEAGASYYLSKASFHDNSLVGAVTNLIGEATRS